MAPSRFQNPYEERQNAVLGRILVNVVSSCPPGNSRSCVTAVEKANGLGVRQDKLNEALLELTKSFGVSKITQLPALKLGQKRRS